MIKIIDASIAIKWFVEEPNREGALAILESLQDFPQHFVVPELFFNEMLAVLCRIENDISKVQRYMYLLENLGLERVGNGSELLNLAVMFSLKYGLSGYDAIYAATAKLMEGVWVTADSKAHKRIAKLHISTLL